MIGAFARRLYLICQSLGVNPRRFWRSVTKLPAFARDWIAYSRSAGAEELPVRLRYLYPILEDLGDEAGVASGHYFHQDLWAARKVFARRPVEHVDVGSRIDGFVAHLLTFMPVMVVDIRPLQSNVPGLIFVQSDGTSLANFEDASVDSLSSLHAVEHFGLGRYGDAIGARAWRDGLNSLARVLRPGGRLYLAVPIGVPRVEFNAHRVFAPVTVLDALSGLDLVSFSVVDDRGDLHENVSPADYARARFSCGLFEYTKPIRGDE